MVTVESKSVFRSVLVILGFVIAASFFRSSYGAEDNAKAEDDQSSAMEQDAEVNGLRLEARLKPGGEVVYGEKLKIEITLSNTTDSDFRTLTSGSRGGLLVIVETDSGNAIRLTRWGSRRLDSPKGSISRRAVTLRAGQSLEHTIELTRAFDLSDAGTYKVRVGWIAHRDLKDKGFPIKTDNIQFVIKEPEQERKESGGADSAR